MSLKQATRVVLCPFLYPARTPALCASSARHLHVSHARRAPPPPPSSGDAHASRSATQEAPPVRWSQPAPQRGSSFASPAAGAGAGEASGSKPPPPPPTLIVEEEIAASPSVAAEAAVSPVTAPAQAHAAGAEACSTLSPQSPAAPRSQKPAASAVAAGGTAVLNAQAQERAAPASSSASAEKKDAEKLPDVEAGTGKTKSKRGMAFKPQRAAITLTPTAIVRLKSLLDSPSGPRLIRIGVKNKGCAGMSYHLEYVKPSEAGRFDERVKQDGVEVLVDSKALFSIIGSEMDWQEDRLSAKFVFNNPNVTEACGCGESWTTI